MRSNSNEVAGTIPFATDTKTKISQKLYSFQQEQ